MDYAALGPLFESLPQPASAHRDAMKARAARTASATPNTRVWRATLRLPRPVEPRQARTGAPEFRDGRIWLPEGLVASAWMPAHPVGLATDPGPMRLGAAGGAGPVLDFLSRTLAMNMRMLVLAASLVSMGAYCALTAGFENLSFDGFQLCASQFGCQPRTGKSISMVPLEAALPGWQLYYGGRSYGPWLTINQMYIDRDLSTLYDPWTRSYYEWVSPFALALGTGMPDEAFEVAPVGQVPATAQLLRYWNAGNPITASLDGVPISVQRNGRWAVGDISL
jgi:hypothetical protein